MDALGPLRPGAAACLPLSMPNTIMLGHLVRNLNGSASRPAGRGSRGMPRWKRWVDVALAVMALPLLLVCTLGMAIVTGLISPGPVFFPQERVGYRGRRFRILKFRTMYVGADTLAHQSYCIGLMRSGAPMAKLDGSGDARLIPGGWLLRATGLDELPQVLNVLLGDMSIVGPRPCVPSEYENYRLDQRERFDAMPGLTGLWQVSGKNRTSFDEMIRLDIHYARHFSAPMDLRIMVATVPALIAQVVEIRRRRTVAALTIAVLPVLVAGVKPSSS